MCGISGYFGDMAPDAGAALLAAMNARLAHRGPDGEGVWQGPGVGLGHRRLAIIDLDCGAQPMACMNGRYRIVFNGEIYNYRLLREELAGLGYDFSTHSDTEVIPAALQAWGVERALSRLRGMFAFVMYDVETRQLTLARDPVGIKPLYWSHAAGAFLFASEPKALLLHDSVRRRVDPAALLDFFTLGAPLAPATAWADIHELEPGTWLTLTEGGLKRGRFWRWKAAPRDWSLTDAIGAAEATLEDSVVAHLESDVPVAAFLSGGVDSSVIVALLGARLGGGLQTYSVGFDEAQYDESAHAQRVATAVGTDHRTLRVGSGTGEPELFERIVLQYDQPFGDSSALPTWLICREVAAHAKVVLSGDGGDEMFGGYARYGTARDLVRLGRIPMAPGLMRGAASLLRHARPTLSRRLAKAAEFSGHSRAQLLCDLHTYFDAPALRELLLPPVHAALMREGPTETRLARLMPPDEPDPVQQLLAIDIQGFLHADYLRKVDVASGAHGLEVRVPYLDPAVMRLSASLPVDLKVRGRARKIVLKALARQKLPASVVDRPKQGFGIPFDSWAGTPAMRAFLQELLCAPDTALRDWCRPQAVQDLYRAFAAARDTAALSRYQVYQRVFFLASFALWLRRWSPGLA